MLSLESPCKRLKLRQILADGIDNAGVAGRFENVRGLVRIRRDQFRGVADMESRDELLEVLRGFLSELFEVQPETVTMNARLSEEPRSGIDAVDLVVKLQELTGSRFRPDEFKSVRTVEDVIDRVHGVLAG